VSNSLSLEGLQAIDAYWRAANYLSVGQIYLLENPLLNEPLNVAHVNQGFSKERPCQKTYRM
jgi:xylulose-5-phosphate/fructose-6-phosphate phosphoketolase